MLVVFLSESHSMRVVINALPTTNLSGRHVLLGHLSQLSRWTVGKHQYIVLYHNANQNMRYDSQNNVEWVQCPSHTANWIARSFWEQTALPRLLDRTKADFLLNVSGAIVPFLKLPQVIYAMNPEPLIPELAEGTIEGVKIRLQKWSYKKTIEKAAMIFFLSEYLRQAYRQNAGKKEAASEIVYAGIDDTLFKAGRMLTQTVERQPYQILTVSVMARRKRIETLIEAIALLRKQELPVTLLLVGPWSEVEYEKTIHNLIEIRRLKNTVKIMGFATRNDLNTFYAQSRLFCLMSRSESFGIPAVEAQVFGTPVVSSNCCAIPEVCGKGGVYPEPDDVEGTATAIRSLLTEKERWKELSELATQNVERFRWETCSRPLLRMFDADRFSG